MTKTTMSALVVVLLLLLGAGMFFSRRPPPPAEAGKLQVAASFYPLGFFASQIGGDAVSVATLTPAGAEPHDYEPTPADIARIEESKVLILNGAGLEAWGARMAENVDPQRTTLLSVSDGIAIRGDPHVWLDPLLAKTIASRIAAAFAQADPSRAKLYRANEAALEKKLDALDRAYAAGLAHCMKSDIVTSHAAFGYLASRYGFTQVSAAGISPDAEPSPQALAAVVALVRAKSIRTIFFESLVSPKLSETIARETGASTLVLDPIEGLTPEDRANGEDYFTVMERNLNHLKVGLQCTT